MQEAPKHSWKDFLRLIFKSKLPWHLYILGFIALIASTTITLGLPKVMQQIFDGEIFDFSIVSKYFILMAFSIVLIGMSALRQSRSEEHTSELQSRFDLVFRLQLEKNKIMK